MCGCLVGGKGLGRCVRKEGRKEGRKSYRTGLGRERGIIILSFKMARRQPQLLRRYLIFYTGSLYCTLLVRSSPRPSLYRLSLTPNIRVRRKWKIALPKEYNSYSLLTPHSHSPRSCCFAALTLSKEPSRAWSNREFQAQWQGPIRQQRRIQPCFQRRWFRL